LPPIPIRHPRAYEQVGYEEDEQADEIYIDQDDDQQVHPYNPDEWDEGEEEKEYEDESYDQTGSYEEEEEVSPQISSTVNSSYL
jgi:hypothetical protein